MKLPAYVRGVVLALLALAAVVMVASREAEGPARCAEGMVALRGRCCGRGQHLRIGGSCEGSPSACARGMEATPRGCVAPTRVVRIEGGRLRLGPGDWEAQGVVVPRDVELPAFGIDAIEATEEAWSACVSLGACPALPLSGEPGRAMRGVTAKEAAGFCDHRGGALPSSDQLAFAAMGSAGRRYPWGDTGAVCRRAAWGLASGPCGWDGTGPELAGSHPDGASRDGVEDLAGNVAEWAIDPSGRAELRGGSFRSAAASDLRGWQRRVVEDGARPDDAGVRCVFP